MVSAVKLINKYKKDDSSYEIRKREKGSGIEVVVERNNHAFTMCFTIVEFP